MSVISKRERERIEAGKIETGTVKEIESKIEIEAEDHEPQNVLVHQDILVLVPAHQDALAPVPVHHQIEE